MLKGSGVISPKALDVAAQVHAGVESDELVIKGFATGSVVMDGILEHSQQRMLEAIEQLARRVDTLVPKGPTGPPMLTSETA